MALVPPNNPANAFGVGSYLLTPRWFLHLPQVTTLNGTETVYSVQDGVDCQVPLSLIPQIEAITSVTLVAPSIFTVSGSPILPGGPSTLTLGLANEAQNSVFIGPSSGGAGQPAFRLLVSADIPPNLALSGVPTAPTATAGTNTPQLATTAYVIGEFASPPTMGAMSQAVSGQFYQNLGATVDRFNDRVFVGGATANNATNVASQPDWLTTYQIAKGRTYGY